LASMACIERAPGSRTATRRSLSVFFHVTTNCFLDFSEFMPYNEGNQWWQPKGGDPQTSLSKFFVAPSLIPSSFGSLRARQRLRKWEPHPSSNNYKVLSHSYKPITNSQQITSGSCNPAPVSVIARAGNMPSSKFVFPQNPGHREGQHGLHDQDNDQHP